MADFRHVGSLALTVTMFTCGCDSAPGLDMEVEDANLPDGDKCDPPCGRGMYCRVCGSSVTCQSAGEECESADAVGICELCSGWLNRGEETCMVLEGQAVVVDPHESCD